MFFLIHELCCSAAKEGNHVLYLISVINILHLSMTINNTHIHSFFSRIIAITSNTNLLTAEYKQCFLSDPYFYVMYICL